MQQVVNEHNLLVVNNVLKRCQVFLEIRAKTNVGNTLSKDRIAHYDTVAREQMPILLGRHVLSLLCTCLSYTFSKKSTTNVPYSCTTCTGTSQDPRFRAKAETYPLQYTIGLIIQVCCANSK